MIEILLTNSELWEGDLLRYLYRYAWYVDTGKFTCINKGNPDPQQTISIHVIVGKSPLVTLHKVRDKNVTLSLYFPIISLIIYLFVVFH